MPLTLSRGLLLVCAVEGWPCLACRHADLCCIMPSRPKRHMGLWMIAGGLTRPVSAALPPQSTVSTWWRPVAMMRMPASGI